MYVHSRISYGFSFRAFAAVVSSDGSFFFPRAIITQYHALYVPLAGFFEAVLSTKPWSHTYVATTHAC